jgi:hypothetical protein
MKTIKIIISLLLSFAMLLSFSGEVMHVHYCLSSKSYSVDFHQSYDNNFVHKSCQCHVTKDEGENQAETNTCCSDPENKSAEEACCLDLHANSSPDKEYSVTVCSFHLDEPPNLIFYSTRPPFFDKYNTINFIYEKSRDHSPPGIISTQVLLI